MRIITKQSEQTYYNTIFIINQIQYLVRHGHIYFYYFQNLPTCDLY